MFGFVENGTFSRRRFLGSLVLAGAVSTVSAACQQAAAPAAPPTSSGGATPGTTASSSTPAPQATAAAASSGPVKVSFTSQGNKNELQMFDKIFDALEKRTPNVKVDRKYDTTLSWPKAINELASGTASDVMRTNDDDIFLLTTAGVLTTLDDYYRDLNRDDYYALAFKTRTGPGGELSRALVATTPLVMFYNVDLLDKAGVKPPTDWDKDTWTMADFESAMSKLAKKTGSRVDVYAWDSPSYWWQVGLWNDGVPWYNQDQTKAEANTPAARTDLEKYQKWTKDGWALPPGTSDTAQSTQLFNGGLLALRFTDSSFEVQINKSIKWDVGPVPKGSAQAGAFHNDRVFTVPNASKVKDGAWTVLNWLLTMTSDGKDGGQYMFAQERWGVPVLRKAAEGPIFNDPSRPPKHLDVYFQGINHGWPIPDNPMGEAFQVVWRTAGDMQNGKTSAEQFLKDAEDLLNKTIQQTGWNKSKDTRGYRLPGVIEKSGAAPKP